TPLSPLSLHDALPISESGSLETVIEPCGSGPDGSTPGVEQVALALGAELLIRTELALEEFRGDVVAVVREQLDAKPVFLVPGLRSEEHTSELQSLAYL